MTTPPSKTPPRLAEVERLEADHSRHANWKRWGPYLSERQWGTVREDYSADGECWDYFPHDHARSRAYRWGEDGLLGISRPPVPAVLRARAVERAGPDPQGAPLRADRPGGQPRRGRQGGLLLPRRHADALLRQGALQVPAGARSRIDALVEENAARGRDEPRVRARGHRRLRRGPLLRRAGRVRQGRARRHLHPHHRRQPRARRRAAARCCRTLWFRNTWSLGPHRRGLRRKAEHREGRPLHAALAPPQPRRDAPRLRGRARGRAPLHRERDERRAPLRQSPNASPYVKDAFHAYVVDGQTDAVNPKHVGTKAAGLYRLEVPARGEVIVYAAPHADARRGAEPFDRQVVEAVFAEAHREADAFYAARIPAALVAERARGVAAGVRGAAVDQAVLPLRRRALARRATRRSRRRRRRRKDGRNSDWAHLYNRDVISMPDKWEYPWYAAWDLAFHMVPLARIDPDFAKEQLLLFLREWYMHPNGQIPAYEFALRRREPAGARLGRVARLQDDRRRAAQRDRVFLERVLPEAAAQLHLVGEPQGRRRATTSSPAASSGSTTSASSTARKPLPDRRAPRAGRRHRVDGVLLRHHARDGARAGAARTRPTRTWRRSSSSTSWRIADAMNTLGGSGLWDEEDGFYYDQLHRRRADDAAARSRSMVGLIPLFAVEVLDAETRRAAARLQEAHASGSSSNRQDLAAAHHASCEDSATARTTGCSPIPSRERLVRVLRYVLDESEFLSPLRHALALARTTRSTRIVLARRRRRSTASTTCPAKSTTGLFGGNSNWRGPDLVPGQLPAHRGAASATTTSTATRFTVECPTGSGADADPRRRSPPSSSARLARIFLPDASGRRPCHGDDDALRERSALARPGALPRVLPRRHRPRPRAPATRPAGRRWWRAASSTWPGRASTSRADPGFAETPVQSVRLERSREASS